MTVKISNLPAATSLGDGDLIPIVQGGTTKKLDFVGDAVTQSQTDTTAGRLLKVGDFGVTGDAILSATTDFNQYTISGFYLTPSSGLTNSPDNIQDRFYLMNQNRSALSVQLAFRRSSDQVFWRSTAGAPGGTWQELYHTGNTTVDANGFVKEASPIVRLFSDHLEEHLQPQGAEFERVDVGHYRITGTLGFAQEGWWIETPKDANGSIKFMTEYEQEDDGTIVIKTYEPIGTGWRPEKGHPVDITEGRWIDIRLQAPEPEEE